MTDLPSVTIAVNSALQALKNIRDDYTIMPMEKGKVWLYQKSKDAVILKGSNEAIQSYVSARYLEAILHAIRMPDKIILMEAYPPQSIRNISWNECSEFWTNAIDSMLSDIHL